MANYLSAIKKTLQWEGGWFSEEHTYRGIMREYHPNWPGWKVVDKKQPLKHNAIIPELEQDVILFYKANYWDKIRLDEVCNDGVAGFMFDFFVNSGRSGIKVIQREIGVDDDGIVGPKTIHAINNYKGDLLERLKMARIGFVRAIVRNDNSKAKFLQGWLNRINSF